MISVVKLINIIAFIMHLQQINLTVDKFNRYTCTTQNFIWSSHDLCEQELFVVLDRLNQEVHVVFLKVGNIMKSVAVLCFWYV